MWKKRFFAFCMLAMFLGGALGLSALAEGEEPTAGDDAARVGEEAPMPEDDAALAAEETAPEGDETPLAAEPAVQPPAQAAAGGASAANAALCARVLRAGPGSEDYDRWLKSLAHIPYVYETQKIGRAILGAAAGLHTRLPVDAALYLVQCEQAPLPGEDVDTRLSQNFNLHGAVYADEAITSVTVSVRHRAISGGSYYPIEATLRFDPGEGRMALGFDEEVNEKGDSLDSLMKFNKLKEGKHAITISVTTAGRAEPVVLYEANFLVVKTRPMYLTSNAFRDNYTTALSFFGGDTAKFLIQYGWKTVGKRDIYTDEAWRDANLVKGSLGRVHVDAYSYFEKANAYLESTYLRVSLGDRAGKVMPLSKLVAKAATYVPRFQSDLRLISHHSFGTAIDVNDSYGPNKNNADNRELIRAEVADHLQYNGIQTDENGQQYYDFSYTGSHSDRASDIPKTLSNYLLYELAFFRAGFNWGYYYDHTCDAMHFSLTDGEYYRHMDSEQGLRKVFEYYN